MHTIKDILESTAAFFQKKGVPSPKLDAQYIIAHGLKMKRMDLFLNFEKPLSEEELALLRPLVARRAKREPLQHVVGSTSFRGHEIACDARALIPRAETEQLVDMLCERLKIAKVGKEKSELIPKENGEKKIFRIADIGTGSGALAISLAKEIENAQIFATDISEEALQLAKENAKLNGCEEKIQFFSGDLLSALPQESLPLDALIANLPYIKENEGDFLQAEVHYDPPLALFGGEDGLSLIRKLLEKLDSVLSENAFALLEMAPGQEKILQRESEKWSSLEWVGAFDAFFGNVVFVEYRKKS